MLKGVDLSHWNSSKDFEYLFNFADFFILKASESISYTDKTYNYRIKKLIQAGKLTGSYHFFKNSDPLKQAENFFQSIWPYLGYTLIVLDVENEKTNWTLVSQLCYILKNRYRISSPIILYVDDSHYKAMPEKLKKEHPIWIARYNSKLSEKDIQRMYPESIMWQASDKGRFNGKDLKVDTDYFFGTIEDMVHLFQ